MLGNGQDEPVVPISLVNPVHHGYCFGGGPVLIVSLRQAAEKADRWVKNQGYSGMPEAGSLIEGLLETFH